jgi:putative N6-adenine-specific DNA methylase
MTTTRDADANGRSEAPAPRRAGAQGRLVAGFLFVSCAQGSEALLAEECTALVGEGAGVQAARGGVMLDADVDHAMRLNLHCRIAQRVLWPLVDAPYVVENDLYELARRVRWPDWITPRETLRVDVTAQRSPLRSLNFAALRVKDAVCDVMREASGARPSVDTRRPDLAISLHLDPAHAWLAIDLSGEPLFKRGWREQQGEAPLKETLAATLLAAAGWRGADAGDGLLDPCCGAGTIAIEAAQIACGIAPGLTRRFAFERLRPFRDHARRWDDLQAGARDAVRAPSAPIWAGDVSFRMTDFAFRNAERAGVAHAIDFKTVDALQRPAPAARGTIVMNPPYGERIEAKGRAARETAVVEGRPEDATGQFFAQLAAHWKRHYADWTAWVLSPDMKLSGAMRLKESRRVPLWNGPIECRLFRFDMVAGSARER